MSRSWFISNTIIIGITNNNSGYNTNNSDYIWLYDEVKDRTQLVGG